MKIISVRAKNYRALHDVQWGSEDKPLGSRCVVFGANGSGKSSLLRVVDLLLNRAPAAASSGSTTASINIPAEPAPVSLGSDNHEAHLEIVLDQDTDRILQHPVFEHDPPESAGGGRALTDLGRRLRNPHQQSARVRLSAKLGVLDDVDHSALLTDLRVDVDGRPLILEGDLAGSTPDGGEITWESTNYAHLVLSALTAGFSRLDCPRDIQAREKRTPTSQDRAAYELPVRLRPPRIEANTLLNRLFDAEHDPDTVMAWRRFQEFFGRDWGHPFLQLLTRAQDGMLGSIDLEYLELLLTDLPAFKNTGTVIPAAQQGTGFAQILYLMAAHLLYEAPIIGIEELEANLDPANQARFWGMLGEDIRYRRTGLDQVLVTSHSPSFLLSQSRRVPEDVDVWFAERDKTGRTRVSRLDNRTRDKVYYHFQGLERPVWTRLSAGNWDTEIDGKRAIYLDQARAWVDSSDTTMASVFSTNEAREIRFVIGRQIDDATDIPAERLLAVDEWLKPLRAPLDTLRVEWVTASELEGAQLRCKVETAPGEGDKQILVLWVEESLPLKTVTDEDDPVAFAEQRFRFIEDRSKDILKELSHSH